MTPATHAPSARIGLTEEELSAMVRQELARPARTIIRGRLVVLPVIAATVLLLVLLEGGGWRLWLCAGAAAVVGVVLVRDAFALRQTVFTPTLIPYVLGPVIVLHTVLIIITGGARSPLLVLYVVTGLVPAVAFGKARPYLAWAAVPLSLLWALSVGAAAGWLPDLTPRLLGGVDASPGPLWIYLQAAVFTLATLFGGGVILAVRAALERTTRRVAAVRQELVETVRERNRELVLLAGELAHELKNPLASIQGLSTLVARRLEPGRKEKEHMEVLLAEVKRMGATLDQFLNFSRPLTRLAVSQVAPGRLLGEAVQLHEGLAQQRGVRLELEPAGSEQIECDPRKVKQVLGNLLQNALDATARGGAVTARCDTLPGGGAALVIDDDGPGLDARVRDRLFEPGVTTKPEGSGLGLTIARAIAEQHGGSLVIEDRDGGGCHAVLALPAAPPPSQQGLMPGAAP